MAEARELVRAPFSYDTNVVSNETGLECLDESLALQSGKEEADINTLVKRFGLTGELPTNLRVPLTVEFSGVSDYHTALNLLREADDAFMEMPADVRERFNHDPGALVAFVSDPANLDEARTLGLAVPAAEPLAPLQVQVIPGEQGS